MQRGQVNLHQVGGNKPDPFALNRGVPARRILCLSMRAAWCVTKRRGGCSMSMFEIVFSPTGGTEKVSGLVTGALDGNIVTVDLTDSGLDFHGVSMAKGDVAVISVPSYAGRVPAVAVERLGMVRGNGARAVLVCVYGGRAFEDTLIELEDVAKRAGFRVVAAVCHCRAFRCSSVCCWATGCAGCGATFRVCAANPVKATGRGCVRALYSRQSSL